MTTIRDVAKHAGVSIGSVSAVINNKLGVSKSTRQRVLQAIEELNYRPNHVARALSKKQTNHLGLLIPDIANPAFGRLFVHIEAQARERGYMVSVGNTHGSRELANDYVERLINMRVDGVLFALTWELANRELIQRLAQHGIIAFGVTSARILSTVPCFTFDEEQGAQAAGNYLYRLGHSKIAFIGPEHSAVSEQRLAGLRKALGLGEITLDDGLVVLTSGYDEEDGHQGALELLGRALEFTCIVVFNDRMAMGALSALEQQNLPVPEVVSLLTFGDTFGRICRPRLTAVVNPEAELAQLAVTKLIDQIEGSAITEPNIYKLSPRLEVRESTRRFGS